MSIRVRGFNQDINVREGDQKDLLQILLDNGLPVTTTCAGKGRCGQCKVQVTQGTANPVGEAEQRLLTRSELAKNMRLACLVEPCADMEIELPHQEHHHRVLSTGFVPETALRPIISKRAVTIERPSLRNRQSYEGLIKAALELADVPLHIISKLSPDQTTYTAVYFGADIIDLEPGDTTADQYGLAVDIGTTTVVATLVDLTTGEQLASEVNINEQTKFGADVLSRISYVIEQGDNGLAKLQRAIVNSLNTMIKTLCEKTGIDRGNIYHITIAANTTMNHLLLNIDPVALGRSPYVPMFLDAKDVAAKAVGLRNMSAAAYLSTLPSVSSFVGSDIVAGIHVSGLHQAQNTSLLIDIGTNGEIVLADQGKLVSCSCAAGPALEGMNISAGMKAADGAIEDVIITEEDIKLAVIGDVAPIGLCGSGVLATIRELIRHQLITKRGRIVDPDQLADTDYRKKYIVVQDGKRAIALTPDIIVTQNDVRQIQLTKAAILSGIMALLNAKNIEPWQIDEVFVAGQFGAHIPQESFIETGIFPRDFKYKINYIGNTSHSGAYLSLISDLARNEMAAIAKHVEYIELSVLDNYEKLFTRSSQFTYPD